jgi:NRAMP (natural resistance-associated macrophage protein)-like metal ion transporter
MKSEHKKTYLQTGAEAPAKFLDKSVRITKKTTNRFISNKLAKAPRKYWNTLGPGFITEAADQDPSGIATFSQTGAQYGFHFLWLALWLWPFDSIITSMTGRIGAATGKGLASNIRSLFSRRVLYACVLAVFAADAITIGADLGAMAKSVQLLEPKLDFGLVVIAFAVIIAGFQIYTSYAKYAKFLKYLALILFAYVGSALLSHLGWKNILTHYTFTPHLSFSKNDLIIICAIIGTTISPYMFFWQSSQEVEEAIKVGKLTIKQRAHVTRRQIHAINLDVWSGAFFCEAIAYFIVAACGGVLFMHGITNIQTAAQAAEALRPFAGQATYLLFAAGIIGAGLLAIPVLAGASSYAISESFGWKEGLYKKLGGASAFYGTIIISMIIGISMNFLGINPIKALIYAAVANGIVAPIVMATILRIGSNEKIMGQWKNSKIGTAVGWFTTVVMGLSGLAAIYALIPSKWL